MGWGPWWTIWKRRDPDGWLMKIGPFAIARANWYGATNWLFHGFGRVIVWRQHKAN